MWRWVQLRRRSRSGCVVYVLGGIRECFDDVQYVHDQHWDLRCVHSGQQVFWGPRAATSVCLFRWILLSRGSYNDMHWNGCKLHFFVRRRILVRRQRCSASSMHMLRWICFDCHVLDLLHGDVVYLPDFRLQRAGQRVRGRVCATLTMQLHFRVHIIIHYDRRLCTYHWHVHHVRRRIQLHGE